MTYEEFINTKTEMSRASYMELGGYAHEEERTLIVYDNHFYINKDGSDYHLIIERSEYTSKDISELEPILWEFAKHEINR